MKITLSLIIEFATITGASSAQAEELLIVITRKMFDLDAAAPVGDTVIDKHILHRASSRMSYVKVGNNAAVSVYDSGVLLFSISTSDYDWFNQKFYEDTDIDAILNAYYGALQS